MDKLPLQNILRQLLCGVVFFTSICVMLPHHTERVLKSLGDADAVTGATTVLLAVSLAVGTLIYHFEKNLYSYSVQISLMRTYPDEKDTESKRKHRCHVGYIGLIGGVVALVLLLILALFSFHCKTCNEWITVTLLALIVLCFIVFILEALLKKENICHVAKSTACLWCAEDGAEDVAGDAHNDTQTGINKIVMRRIANWTDFIHCGQCCAFAWILGSFCVFVYCTVTEYQCSYFVINIGLLASLSALFFDLFADWHRYQYVRYVIRNSNLSNFAFPTL